MSVYLLNRDQVLCVYLLQTNLGEFRSFADKEPVGPRIESEDGGRKRDSADKNKEIANSQVKNISVWHTSHGLVPKQDPDEASISYDSNQEDETEDHWHYERFRPVVVGNVAAIV